MTDYEKVLSLLTEKQKRAFELRQTLKSFATIGELMGDISPEAARKLCYGAERKFREYERNKIKLLDSSQCVNFSITRGELKIICEALNIFYKQANSHVKRFYREEVCDLKMVHELLERIQNMLYQKNYSSGE